MRQPFSLAGKVAVVTGGGSGIGRAIALSFAAHGATVAIFDASEAAARAVCEQAEPAGSIRPYLVDVTDASAVERAFAALQKDCERLDVLVNNAGIAHVGRLDNTSLDDFERVYQVNVRGAFLCARAALERMLAQGSGVILNMASIASLIGLEDRFAYSVSKGALLSMTRSIAVDYMTKGIRCNAICPARVHTPFVDGFVARNYPGREAEMLAQLAAYQPLGRMGTPEEVALLALYLCSDAASFITGQAFPIDGGVLVK
jgi:NAD(P)-dependent dehydrogenase (short-subunit alcohol dehydrogenase family)